MKDAPVAVTGAAGSPEDIAAQPSGPARHPFPAAGGFRWRVALLWLLLAALFLLLRLPGLTASIDYHFDEQNVYRPANAMIQGRLIPEPLFYPMGATLLHLPAQVLGEYLAHSTRGGLLTLHEQGVCARLFALALNAATIAMCCLLVLRLGCSRRAALLCALMLLSGSFYVEQARYATTDTVLPFFIVLMALYVHESYRKPRRAYALALACLLAGAATSVKYNAALFALLPALALLHQRRDLLLRLPLGLAAFCAGLLLFNPVMLADPKKFFGQLLYEAAHYGYHGHLGFDGGLGSNLVYALAFFLLFCDGVGLLAFAPWAGRHGGLTRCSRPFVRLLLVVLGIYLLFICKQKVFFLRNLYAACFPLTILAACAIDYYWGRWGRLGRVLLIASLGFMIARGVALSLLLAGPDTRALAERYVREQGWDQRGLVLRVGQFQPHYPSPQQRVVEVQQAAASPINPGEVLSLSLAKFEVFAREAGSPLGAREACQAQARAAAQVMKLNQPYLARDFQSGTSHWLFGNQLRGSTLRLYEKPRLLLYHR